MSSTPQQQKQRKQRLSNQHKPYLSITNFTLLKDLFKLKGWECDPDRDISQFSKFVKTLSLLDNKQQLYLIDMTKDFLWYDSTKYRDMTIDALQKLRASVGDRHIFFAQCLPQADASKNKSSSHVLYGLEDKYISYHVDMGSYKRLNHVSEANEQMLLDDEAVLVLVDDFVGTGETAQKALSELSIYYPRLRDFSNVKVLSLVVQKTGFELLTSMKLDVFYAKKVGKAISDLPVSDDEKYERICMMQSIERRIKGLEEKFKFGYEGSEALVSMIRCPNNTFPIYWYIEGVSPYEREH